MFPMELYYFVGIMLVASTLQGITGFGGGLIAAPLLLLVFDKSISVISLVFVSVTINTLLLVRIRRPVDKTTFYDLFIPSLFGLPIGLLVLHTLDIIVLRILVGFLSLVFAILLFSKNVTVKNSKLKRLFAGWFSGVLHTSIGPNSPPIVLLLAAENTDKDEMRKTMAFLFLMMSLVSLPLFFLTKHLTKEVWMYALVAIPTALIGGWIGDIISKKVSQKGFIWSVFILITVSLVVAVYSGLKG